MDRRWPLIGIAGVAGAGKDVVARRLVQRWGFVRIGFADALKDEVLEKFPRTMLKIWEDSAEGADVPDDREVQKSILRSLIETKPGAIRTLLQEYGTEVRRLDDTDYWVARWLDRCSQDWDRRIVTPDMRFENEFQTIKRWGLVVKVVRPDAPGAGTHASETGVAAWPDSTFDWCAQNVGTLEDLERDVDEWVARQYQSWR